MEMQLTERKLFFERDCYEASCSSPALIDKYGCSSQSWIMQLKRSSRGVNGIDFSTIKCRIILREEGLDKVEVLTLVR